MPQKQSSTPMNAQSRMAKTLGCLVGAMTGGALLLQWCQPAGVPADEHYAVQLRALEIKETLKPDRAATDAWRGVVIRASHPQSHFRVTDRGEVIATANWQQQRSADGAGVIEISVDGADAKAAPLPAVQARTLLALISELQHGYLPPRAAVQLDEPSFRTRAEPLQQIRGLLRSAGITG